MADNLHMPRPAEITAIVGAGISVPAPTHAPDFQALRDRFLQLADASLNTADFQLDELSPEQVFDAIDDGREELRAAVRRELWWLCEPNEPNSNHYAVAALLAAGVTVWTPNFDTMIERAAAREQIRVRAVVPGEPLDALSSAARLYKPHGSFPYTGDPPREPASHSYRLLFQASAVWLLDEAWSAQLRDDIAGRDIVIFGYRGADPDLTPIMLRAFEDARSVTWWEFATARNFRRLETLLEQATRASVRPGSPSDALEHFAQSIAPHATPAPLGVSLARPTDLGQIQLSYSSRARLLEQFRGPAAARRHLLRAALFDPPANRKRALFRFFRSLGYDVWWMRGPLLAGTGIARRLPYIREWAQLSELRATWIYARPLRRNDVPALRELLGAPNVDRADLLIRIASKEKLLGYLDPAVADTKAALNEIGHQQVPQPRLEAMAVYNLAWTYRQRGEFDLRADLVGRYADRMPHIGFNWAAWLKLDDVLVALHFGDAASARALMESPFLTYARSLIGHSMYRLDDSLTEALVAWHEKGPAGIDCRLEEILRRQPIRPLIHPPFAALDTLIVLGDHARAVGDRESMRRLLRKARRRTSSPLQEAEIELVEATSSGDGRRLLRLRDEAERRRFGLIAQTAHAVATYQQGQHRSGHTIVYAPSLPLAGTY